MVCRRCGCEFDTRRNLLKDGSTKCPKCGAVYRKKPQPQRNRQRSHVCKNPNAEGNRNATALIALKKLLTRKLWKFPVWLWLIVLFVICIVPTNDSSVNEPKQQESYSDDSSVNNVTEMDFITETVLSTAIPSATVNVEPTTTFKYSTTGVTITDFTTRFEAGMQHFGVPCTVIDQGFDDNGYGMLTVDEHLAMNYTLADGKISDLFLFASGDGTIESGARIMCAIASSMYGLDETTIATETGTIITNMINDGTTHIGTNYVMSGSTNDFTGTTVVFSGTVR